MSGTQFLSAPTRSNPWMVTLEWSTGETTITLYEDMMDVEVDEETGETGEVVIESGAELAMREFVRSFGYAGVSRRIISEVHPVEVRVPMHGPIGKISYIEVEIQ